jgi:hypothetical protein
MATYLLRLDKWIFLGIVFSRFPHQLLLNIETSSICLRTPKPWDFLAPSTTAVIYPPWYTIARVSPVRGGSEGASSSFRTQRLSPLQAEDLEEKALNVCLWIMPRVSEVTSVVRESLFALVSHHHNTWRVTRKGHSSRYKQKPTDKSEAQLHSRPVVNWYRLSERRPLFPWRLPCHLSNTGMCFPQPNRLGYQAMVWLLLFNYFLVH